MKNGIRQSFLLLSTMTIIDPTDSTRSKTALVLYPASQSYVVETLRTAFSQQPEPWNFYTDRNDLEPDEKPDVQWSDYDELDWDWAMDDARLLNSFAIRKASVFFSVPLSRGPSEGSKRG